MSRLTKETENKFRIMDVFFDQYGYTPDVFWSGRGYWYVWASEVGEYMCARGPEDNITFESIEASKL